MDSTPHIERFTQVITDECGNMQGMFITYGVMLVCMSLYPLVSHILIHTWKGLLVRCTDFKG